MTVEREGIVLFSQLSGRARGGGSWHCFGGIAWNNQQHVLTHISTDQRQVQDKHPMRWCPWCMCVSEYDQQA